jgi:hypothetical protein
MNFRRPLRNKLGVSKHPIATGNIDAAMLGTSATLRTGHRIVLVAFASVGALVLVNAQRKRWPHPPAHGGARRHQSGQNVCSAENGRDNPVSHCANSVFPSSWSIEGNGGGLSRSARRTLQDLSQQAGSLQPQRRPPSWQDFLLWARFKAPSMENQLRCYFTCSIKGTGGQGVRRTTVYHTISYMRKKCHLMQ